MDPLHLVLHWVLHTRILVLTKLIPLYTISAVLLAIALLPPGTLRRLRRRRPAIAVGFDVRALLVRLLVFAIGAAVGLVVAFVASDVVNVVAVRFTPIIRIWIAVAFGGVTLGIFCLIRNRGRTRLIAGALVPVALIAGASGINVDVAAFPTLNSIFHTVEVPPLALPTLPATLAKAASWQPPPTMPKRGVIGSVRIPPTRSGFNARTAIVYLPPAALTASPPRLPVVLSLSGQPGWPTDVFVNGGIAEVADAYAAAHRGIAPIIVAADQIGLPGNNPMCVDSPLGNVDTYLTQDVPAWVQAHLPAATTGWGLEGFSQGGTCVMQLLAAHPDRFSTGLAIAAEAVPVDRGAQNTINEAFGGSAAKYAAAAPAAIMQRHGPYPRSLAMVAWGQNDTDYGSESSTLITAARRAGMPVLPLEAPGSAHDWHTVGWAIEQGVPRMTAHMLAAGG